MTKEQELLLALLRGELTGTAAELDEKTLSGADWDAVLKESQAQAVTLMAADALSPFGKYVTNIGAWTSCAARLMRANFALLQSEAWLEHAIAPEPMVILKGMSAASYYCKPSGRVLGDIDFLTDPAKTDALLDCLTEKGCKIIDEPGDSSHHRELTHGSTLLELHFAIPGIPFGKAGELVRARAAGILSRRVIRELDGQKFPSPAPEDHALVLLLHTQNHMQEAGVGLRHLCDWAAFLRAEADGAFWPELLDFLKEIGLLRFAEVLSKTCAMYLGAPLLDFAKDAPEELATGILEDILSGGNFGRRDETHSGSAVFLPSFRGEEKRQTRTQKLWQSLLGGVRSHHPIVKKVPVLIPFFALWRAILYIVRAALGKRQRLGDMRRVGRDREALFRALRLFEGACAGSRTRDERKKFPE